MTAPRQPNGIRDFLGGLRRERNLVRGGSFIQGELPCSPPPIDHSSPWGGSDLGSEGRGEWAIGRTDDGPGIRRRKHLAQKYLWAFLKR